MVLFYLASIVEHNFIFARARCDLENTPPLRLPLCRGPLTLSLMLSMSLALFLCLPTKLLCLLSTPFGFSELLCLAEAFGLLLSLCLALFLFLPTPFGFS